MLSCTGGTWAQWLEATSESASAEPSASQPDDGLVTWQQKRQSASLQLLKASAKGARALNRTHTPIDLAVIGYT